MTPDELYARGYCLEYAAWGVSVYRTIDGSPEPSDSSVKLVAAIHFDQPLNGTASQARGWEAAEVHFVANQLSK